jgi:hypothetical protein
MTDIEVVAVVKKFLKGIDEMLGVITPPVGPATDAQAKLDKILAEKAALEAYLPKQMSEDELRAFATAKAAEGLNMGQIMKALTAERAGQYDGKTASGIVKAALAG